MVSYYITIAFYSEPNYRGNCSIYYLKGIKGNKISYGGTMYKKLYLQKSAALKAAKKIKNAFTTAKVEVNEIIPINGVFNTIVIQ
jgi:hypothetical protein